MKILEALSSLLEAATGQQEILDRFPGFQPRDATVLKHYLPSLSRSDVEAAFDLPAIKSMGKLQINVFGSGDVEVTLAPGAEEGSEVEMNYHLRNKVADLVSLYLPGFKQGNRIAIDFLLLQLPFAVNKLGITAFALVAVDVGSYAWLSYGFEPEDDSAKRVTQLFNQMYGDLVSKKFRSLKQLALCSVPVSDIEEYIKLDGANLRAKKFQSVLGNERRFFVLKENGTELFLLGKFFLIKTDIHWYGWLKNLSGDKLGKVMNRLTKLRGKR